MEHDEASRIVNVWFGGRADETFCSRLWRERWRRPWLWLVIWRIDREAVRRFGEDPGHCRRAAFNHRLAMAEPDDVLRLTGG